MTIPQILTGEWRLNGANVTAKGAWQLAVASPPYTTAPIPKADALAKTHDEAMQIATAISTLPDALTLIKRVYEGWDKPDDLSDEAEKILRKAGCH